MPEHALIFANPIAGRGQGKAIAHQLAGHLRKAGYGVELFLDKADSVGWDPGGRRVRGAIVIGGDGTLRGVAQWAIDSAMKLAGSGSNASAASWPWPLLIVPMGTANLMGKHLGLRWDHDRLGEQVERTLREHRLVQLDVATTPDGIFLLMAGIGFDAWIVHELDRVRSGPIDYTKYVLPALKAVQQYHFHDLRVTVDDRVVFAGAPALAMVGNVREYGTGFPMLPLARSDDQLLDVCVMPVANLVELARMALAATIGKHIEEPGVVYVKGRQVRVESPDAVPVQVDGEPAGTTPLDVGLLPGRIPFMVPTSKP
jgi:diacylglycerol kinase family enzyme